jgi:transcriptional regulator with XRE-family HTH domain
MADEDLDFPNQRLRFARKRAGFKSAAAAARAMGIKVPTYQGHENGSREGFIENAEMYAQRFNVSFEWLWTHKGPMERHTLIRDDIADLPPDRQQAVRDFIEWQRTRP